MKYIFTLILLVLFQESYSQKKEYTIFTKSGEYYTTQKYAEKNNEISFKSNGKTQSIAYSQLDKIVSSGKKSTDNYTKKFVYYSDDHGTLMTELVAGNVSLFERVELIPTSGGATGITFQRIITYFVKKPSENVATNIGINELFKNYKKTSKDFFSDCPQLVSKLENKEFKKKDIKEVVVFYNENCGN